MRFSGVNTLKKDMTMDLCSGPIMGNLLRFSIPLMLSGILQLLFNSADIIVLGQFAGGNAMAAVGSTSSLNNLIVNIFLGLSAGGSVVVAQYFGMKSDKDLEESVHTAILLGLISGLILVVVGLLLAEPMLALMGTTPDLIDQAVLYMRIIFAGMPAIMVYDFGAGILRAVGDTRRPLLYLSLGGVVNVALNLFFVLAFDMGVAGVAIGTVVSQTLAAFLVVRCLVKTEASYGIRLRRLRIVKAKLIRILRIGIPTGVQGAVFSISNVLIQSAINSFDSSTIVGGNTASVNIENFVYTAMNAVYQGSLTFTSQNVGAHNVKRIVPIMWWSSLCVTAVGLLLGVTAVVFGRALLGIYSPDPQIIAYGFDRLKLIGLTYFLCGLMDTVCGCIRGLGASITPTLISLTGACALRIVWIYTIFASTRSLFMLYLSYPVSWLVTYIANLVCFAVTYRRWKCRALASTTIVNGYTVG